jgi:glycosyltransferase involved in cell wall biosynthesis
MMISREHADFIPALDRRLEGRRALFISYNGMLDPLGQSQVLPYLRELTKVGVRFTLLSFERDQAFTDAGRDQSKRLKAQLAKENIEWHWLRYHQRPSLPATTYDVFAGIRYAQALVKRNEIEVVHARSHVPATIALVLKKRFGLKMIFDIRGLMAEEYVDAEHWTKGSIPYRLTKNIEGRAMKVADAVVTLTHRIWPIISTWDSLSGRSVVHEVIPCCADLERFRFSRTERLKRREELKLENRFTIVYSGSLDGWYLTERMADFFVSVLRRRPDAYFLWLTNGRQERVEELMAERGISRDSYSVRSVKSEDVPSFLSAADAGISFIKPCFSKLASSPTKNAEYLACGLPMIINAGIGDSDALIGEGVGTLVTEFNEAEYEKAIASILGLVQRPEEIRARTREVAERFFSLKLVGGKRYARLYERLLLDAETKST